MANRLSADALLEVAANLDLFSPSNRPVLLRSQPKGSGGYRTIWSFQFEDKARQVLAKWALEPFLDIAPSQYTLRGGRDAACQAVASAMANGFKWVVLTDVQDCFGSFVAEKLAGTLPLPRRVTEGVILSRAYSTEQVGSRVDLGLSGCVMGANRRGIPQGSAASSYVQEHELSVLAAAVPDFARAVVFADNILVLTRSRSAGQQVIELLNAAARQHRVGPLPLKTMHVRPTSEPFTFLGYNICRRRGRTIFEPHPLNYYRAEARWMDVLGGATDEQRGRRQLVGWARAFHLWPSMVPWLESCVQEIEGEAPGRRLTDFPLRLSYM